MGEFVDDINVCHLCYNGRLSLRTTTSRCERSGVLFHIHNFIKDMTHTRTVTVASSLLDLVEEESAGTTYTRQSTTTAYTCNYTTSLSTRYTAEKWNERSSAPDLDVLHYTYADDAEMSQCTASYVSASAPQSTRQDPYRDVSIEVNNYSFTSQGVVMYHVDIKGPEGVLSTYTIRRRYRAFKNLYHMLQRFYYAKNARSNANGFEIGSFRRQQSTFHTLEKIPSEKALIQQNPLQLPALPSAGMWSYLKRHDIRLVEQRKKQLEGILRVATRHPILRHCPALDAFLSVAPSEISQRGSSYVSLQDYSVPKLDHHRESIERKQIRMRVLEGKRRKTRAMSDAGLISSLRTQQPVIHDRSTQRLSTA